MPSKSKLQNPRPRDHRRYKVVKGSVSISKNPPSLDRIDVELTQSRCPQGHPLPYKTDFGSCTPVYCAMEGVDAEKKPKRESRFVALGKEGAAIRQKKNEVMALLAKEADKVIDTLIPETTPGFEQARAAAKAQKGEELLRLAQGIGRYAAMKAYFNVPEGLEGSAAEEYVQRKALMLSVDALAEIERQLKLGDDNQRREAARDILDMNGMRKREASAGNQAVIILNNPAGLAGLPWLKVKDAPAIEGEVVDEKKHS